jgi:hypothetical protein
MYRGNFLHQCVETKIWAEASITKSYSVTAIMPCYILALSHNALCCGEKLLLLKVTALGIKESLSLLIVFALVTFRRYRF